MEKTVGLLKQPMREFHSVHSVVNFSERVPTKLK